MTCLSIEDFSADRSAAEHLERHLTLLFDRGFEGPDRQWSVNELDHQLQLALALLQSDKERGDRVPMSANVIARPTYTVRDPVPCITLLIAQLKSQLVNRHSQCLRWSTGEHNRWKVQSKEIENQDVLLFRFREKEFSLDVRWCVEISSGSQFSLRVCVSGSNTLAVELPLGVRINHPPSEDFDRLLKNLETDMTAFLAVTISTLVQQ